jgi:hypothetical protein
MGSATTDQHRKLALLLAQDYLRSAPTPRLPTACVRVVAPNRPEPVEFTRHFFGWRPKAAQATSELIPLSQMVGQCTKYPYQLLLYDDLPSDVDPQHLEVTPPHANRLILLKDYIIEPDFKTVFGMSRDQWDKLEPSLQQTLKEQAYLVV